MSDDAQYVPAAQRLSTRASNSPIPPKNPFRVGRVQRAVKRAIIALDNVQNLSHFQD